MINIIITKVYIFLNNDDHLRKGTFILIKNIIIIIITYMICDVLLKYVNDIKDSNTIVENK